MEWYPTIMKIISPVTERAVIWHRYSNTKDAENASKEHDRRTSHHRPSIPNYKFITRLR